MKGYFGIGVEGVSKAMNVGTLFRTAHAFEIADDAIELPSFRHPRQAAYILGAEREGLSAELQKHCDYLVRIPTRFSVNLGVAAALVMYDRLLTLGRHAPRPVAEGAPTEAAPLPVFGDPIYKRKQRARARLRAKE
jgi:tRNA G18 (ribose-2'-O)-methylase SpoU